MNSCAKFIFKVFLTQSYLKYVVDNPKRLNSVSDQLLKAI